MNWIGGARARAKAREQSNIKSNRQHKHRRNLTALLENVEGDEELDDDNRNSGQAAGESINDNGMRRNLEDNRTESNAKNIDYAALGYRLARPEKNQRRVVPLLEFIEKKFAKGDVLSLHLSHLMDITKIPNTSEQTVDTSITTSEQEPPSSSNSVTMTTRTSDS